jgi:hypothetical protein
MNLVHRVLRHPATWLLLAFIGLFIIFAGATVAFGIALGSGLCALGGCLKVPGWMNWAVAALDVILLVGGIVGYVVVRDRQDRDQSN